MTSRTIIKANQSWFHIPWHEIYEYRDLLWNLVRRDLTAIYKQSILGPLWFIIVPLVTTIVFTVIFGNVAKISTDGLPPFLFYMTSMVLWNYFQGCMNGVSNSLITNAGIFSKVYFPRLIVPLSLILSNLAQFVLNLIMFLGFYLYFVFFTSSQIQPSWWILMLPVLIFHCAAVGMGVGLWLSALTVKYRDLRFALPFIAQLWMYATPIVYPTSLVPEKWRWLLAVNPMAGIMEFNRFAFLGVGTVSKEILLIGLISGLFLLVSGLLIFNKVQRTFVDTI
jgi:lipopolysaccharide transport system permease protein